MGNIRQHHHNLRQQQDRHQRGADQTFYTLATANLVTADPSVGSIFSVTGGSPIAGLFALGGRINSTGTTINVTSGNGVTGAEAGNGGVVDMTNNTDRHELVRDPGRWKRPGLCQQRTSDHFRMGRRITNSRREEALAEWHQK